MLTFPFHFKLVLKTVLSPSDHSFFGPEWQKRWCALSQNIFYYYGSEKGLVFILPQALTLQMQNLKHS